MLAGQASGCWLSESLVCTTLESPGHFASILYYESLILSHTLLVRLQYRIKQLDPSVTIPNLYSPNLVSLGLMRPYLVEVKYRYQGN